MVPISDRSSSPDHPKKKTFSFSFSKTESLLIDHNTAFNNNNNNSPPPHHFSLSHLRCRTCPFVSFVSLQILLFLAARSLPFSLPFRHHGRPFPSSPVAMTDALASPVVANSALPLSRNGQCASCRIYVYELPSFFNVEILKQCDNLNPWSSSCDSLVNNGFGPPATHLSRIVPKNLAPAWFRTDQFVSEIIFHNRILKHKCRTLEPGSAAAFYIPKSNK